MFSFFLCTFTETETELNVEVAFSEQALSYRDQRLKVTNNLNSPDDKLPVSHLHQRDSSELSITVCSVQTNALIFSPAILCVFIFKLCSSYLSLGLMITRRSQVCIFRCFIVVFKL